MTQVIANLLDKYESSYLIRAMVQLIPYAGAPVDTIFAGRSAEINKKRFEEFLENIIKRIELQEKTALSQDYLSSDEFFELFRTAVEVATKSSDERKRRLIADFLVGDAIRHDSNSLKFQIIEDLRLLQVFHFEVLRSLPKTTGTGINREHPPESIHNMPPEMYQKAISDLERLGFIAYDTSGIGTLNGGGGHWKTTAYLSLFWEIMTGAPDSDWRNSASLDDLFD